MLLTYHRNEIKPRIRWRQVLLLLGLAVLVHHPILWIDHILWDEVSFEKMALTGDLSGKLSSATDQSIPTVYPLYALFARLPEPTKALRLAAFLALWFTAVAVAAILRDFAGARRESSLAAGVLVLTYPAFQLYANAGATIYVLSLALFSGGVWCGLMGLRATSQRGRNWFILAAAFLLMSFVMQSLFVYFYGVVALVAVLGWHRKESTGWPELVAEKSPQLRIIALLLLIPLLNYYFLRHFFPLHPYFGSTDKGYNVPQFDLPAMVRNSVKAFSATILSPLQGLFEMPLVAWLVGGVLARGTLAVLSDRGMDPGRAAIPPTRKIAPVLVAGGMLLLMLGLFPYIVVGKPPTPEGVQTRFAILVAPSLAVILCGLLELLDSPKARQWGLAVCIVAFTGFAWQHAWNYANWQICAIKDHACVAALRRITPPEKTRYFWIRGINLEHTYHRQFYDWGRLFHEAWGGYESIGMPETHATTPGLHYYTPLGISRDHVADFAHWMGYGDPHSPAESATVVLESSPDFAISDDRIWSTVWRDLTCRLGLATETREAWLAHFITSVSIEPSRPFPYDSNRLSLQPFLRANPFHWWDARTRPAVTAGDSPHLVTVYTQKDGKFFVLPAGDQGIVLRCDGVESRLGREAELDLSIEVGPVPANAVSQTWGVALSIPRADNIVAPRLVLALADGTEIEGTWKSSTLDSLEVWSPAGATSLPVRAWIVWRPLISGSRLHCHSIRAGWVQLGE